MHSISCKEHEIIQYSAPLVYRVYDAQNEYQRRQSTAPKQHIEEIISYSTHQLDYSAFIAVHLCYYFIR